MNALWSTLLCCLRGSVNGILKLAVSQARLIPSLSSMTAASKVFRPLFRTRNTRNAEVCAQCESCGIVFANCLWFRASLTCTRGTRLSSSVAPLVHSSILPSTLMTHELATVCARQSLCAVCTYSNCACFCCKHFHEDIDSQGLKSGFAETSRCNVVCKHQLS